MIYRDMTKKDVDLVIKFYMECYNDTDNDEWTYEVTFKRIMQIFMKPDSRCYIVESHNEILGFAMGYIEEFIPNPYYFLSEIVVSPKLRGQGYGTKFMTYIEENLKEDNVNKIILLSANDEMHKYFYNSLGYVTHRGIICMEKYI